MPADLLPASLIRASCQCAGECRVRRQQFLRRSYGQPAERGQPHPTVTAEVGTGLSPWIAAQPRASPSALASPRHAGCQEQAASHRDAARTPTPPGITMYGTSRCSDCRRATKFFGDHRVRYTFVDVDRDAESRPRRRSRPASKACRLPRRLARQPAESDHVPRAPAAERRRIAAIVQAAQTMDAGIVARKPGANVPT
ncbi:MAG: hypothetical protein IT306_03800 [Chloroflexi bacterium]|nr:hypothetical protein [Chloroflexota bacterium]